jgi:hypothetical protein
MRAPKQQDDNSNMMTLQQQYPLCSAFLVLAIHTAAFVAIFANTPVFAAAARDWQFGGFLFLKARWKAKEGRVRNGYRRLARGKQDIQISSQTAAATTTAESAKVVVVVGIDVGIPHVGEKGTEIECVGGSSIR